MGPYRENKGTEADTMKPKSLTINQENHRGNRLLRCDKAVKPNFVSLFMENCG